MNDARSTKFQAKEIYMDLSISAGLYAYGVRKLTQNKNVEEVIL